MEEERNEKRLVMRRRRSRLLGEGTDVLRQEETVGKALPTASSARRHPAHNRLQYPQRNAHACPQSTPAGGRRREGQREGEEA